MLIFNIPLWYYRNEILTDRTDMKSIGCRNEDTARSRFKAKSYLHYIINFIANLCNKYIHTLKNPQKVLDLAVIA